MSANVESFNIFHAVAVTEALTDFSVTPTKFHGK